MCLQVICEMWTPEMQAASLKGDCRLQFSPPLFSVSGSLFQDAAFQIKAITPIMLSARQDSVGRGSWWSSLLYLFPLSYVIDQEAMNLLMDSLKTCHRLTPTSKYYF